MIQLNNLFKSFFNTTHEVEKLPEYNSKAQTQNERVLKILTEAKTHLTPFEILARYCAYYKSSTPITSIRRSLTVLTKKEKLEKVDIKKNGNYGRANYQWKIK
jgi:Fe2+ or Zn2+ uptake regulation protein